MLEVIVPPVSALLTTLDTARDELGDLGAQCSDATLLRKIRRVSAVIADVCQIHPLQTVRERAQVYPAGVRLTVRPVREVITVARNGVDVAAEGCTFDARSGLLTWTGLTWPMVWDFGYGDAGCVHYEPWEIVTYTGGYVMPGQDARTLPDDVEAVCLDMVRAAVSNGERDPSIRAESQEGAGSIQYFDASGQDGLPAGLAALAARYAPVAF